MIEKITKSKIFLFAGLLALVLVFSFGPLAANEARADFFDITGGVAKKILAILVELVLNVASSFLALSGFLFDYTIQFSILNYFGSGEFVERGWTTVRDLTNVVFIFILLYTAIMTILNLGGVDIKKTVGKVILVALFVNFSLVITRVVIDSTNILAVEFYNKMNNIEDFSTSDPNDTLTLSAGIARAIGPQNFFKPPKEGIFSSIFDSEETTRANHETTLLQIAISGVFGIILILAFSFVLLAGGIMFILRTAALWLIMILSPAAFVCYAIPGAEHFFSSWKKKLVDQALFAPAYMFYLYIVVKIIAESKLLASTGAENLQLDATNKSLDTASAGLIFKYLIVLFLLTAALKLANEMGAYGASAANKYFDQGKGWLTGKAKKISQNPAAWASRRLAKSDAMQKFASKSPRVGGAVLRTVQSGAKLGTYDQKVATRLATAEKMKPQFKAAYITNLGKPGLVSAAVGRVGAVAGKLGAPGLARGASAVAGGLSSVGSAANKEAQKKLLEGMSVTQRSAMYNAASDTEKAQLETLMLTDEVFEKMSAREKIWLKEVATKAGTDASGKLVDDTRMKAVQARIDILPQEERDKVVDEEKKVVERTKEETAKTRAEDNLKELQNASTSLADIQRILSTMKPSDITKIEKDPTKNPQLPVILQNIKGVHLAELAKSGNLTSTDISAIKLGIAGNTDAENYINSAKSSDIWA